MSHRLSKLLGDLQEKVTAATHLHSTPTSYGSHPNSHQVPYGQSNSNNSYAPCNAPPPYGSQNHHAMFHGPTNPQTAPALYGPPAHASLPLGMSNQYIPSPAGRPYSPYGQPAQHSPSAPYGPNPMGTSNSYSAPNSYPPQFQQPPPQAPPSAPTAFPRHISVRLGGFMSDSVAIHAADSPDAPALYSFRTSKSQPNIVMLHPGTNTVLGEANFSTSGSSVHISLRGQPMKMRQNMLGDKFTFESTRGTFRWKFDQLTGSMSKLVDGDGRTVANYKGGGMPGMGDKSIEVLMPVDQQLFELVILSYMAAKALNKKNEKAVLQGVEAVAGF